MAMEVDTGAAVSVMSDEVYSGLEGGQLTKSSLRLKTYTGEIMRPLGVGWLRRILRRYLPEVDFVFHE